VDDRSPLAAALERVGDRWSLLIVDALLDGPRRFNELLGDVQGIAPNILSQRLKRLEQARIVVASPLTARPPRLSYGLSEDGRELAGALRLLADWGSRGDEDAEPLRHVTCGTPLQAHWYCPTCSRAVLETDQPELRYV
jgi:DNA-binding HxlR family transcriptional regulator